MSNENDSLSRSEPSRHNPPSTLNLISFPPSLLSDTHNFLPRTNTINQIPKQYQLLLSRQTTRRNSSWRFLKCDPLIITIDRLETERKKIKRIQIHSNYKTTRRRRKKNQPFPSTSHPHNPLLLLLDYLFLQHRSLTISELTRKGPLASQREQLPILISEIAF